MAKELWCISEAKKILSKYKDIDIITFETGYGPSGLPHIGTFAEVARTSYVIDALQYIAPEIKTKLIVFSDDMDGLRKTPDTIPNKEKFQVYLGTPLCDIPDPFEKEASFSGYMNKQLQLFLDQFGFEYEFKSSAVTYRNGEFNEGLKRIFLNRERIKSIFVKSISEDKRESWEPFFITCDGCGKINTTRVVGYHEEDFTVDYVCDNNSDVYRCCGHQGRGSVLDGNAKVGWKVDWALRWFMLGIQYEMHGEDLTDSGKMSSQICKVISQTAPITYKYELFLDEEGKKISKKLGNGLSMEQWLDLAPTEALAYFLIGNPNKTKKMGLPILPKIVDEYLQAISTNPELNGDAPLWYIRKLSKKKYENLSSQITYSLLSNLAESLSIEDANILYNYAVNYDPVVKDNAELYFSLCEKVILYLKELKAKYPQQAIIPNADYLKHLQSIKDFVEKQDANSMDGSALQTELFTISKENEIPMREWFQFLYQTILNKNEGPKMGFFFALIGKEKSLELINASMQRYQS